MTQPDVVVSCLSSACNLNYCCGFGLVWEGALLVLALSGVATLLWDQQAAAVRLFRLLLVKAAIYS
jgi:hypothetical protein